VKTQFIVKVSLLLSLATLVAVMVIRETPRAAEADSPPALPAEHQSSSPKVIAYYFHTNARCSTCRKIEALSGEALEQGFAGALKSGELEWRVVNIEERANRHFVGDYQLFTKSVIVVKLKDGKQTEWKNLRRVWELVNRKDAFQRYVQDEVWSYLEAS